jgi:hypothetical protein
VVAFQPIGIGFWDQAIQRNLLALGYTEKTFSIRLYRETFWDQAIQRNLFFPAFGKHNILTLQGHRTSGLSSALDLAVGDLG